MHVLRRPPKVRGAHRTSSMPLVMAKAVAMVYPREGEDPGAGGEPHHIWGPQQYRQGTAGTAGEQMPRPGEGMPQAGAPHEAGPVGRISAPAPSILAGWEEQGTGPGLTGLTQVPEAGGSAGLPTASSLQGVGLQALHQHRLSRGRRSSLYAPLTGPVPYDLHPAHPAPVGPGSGAGAGASSPGSPPAGRTSSLRKRTGVELDLWGGSEGGGGAGAGGDRASPTGTASPRTRSGLGIPMGSAPGESQESWERLCGSSHATVRAAQTQTLALAAAAAVDAKGRLWPDRAQVGMRTDGSDHPMPDAQQARSISPFDQAHADPCRQVSHMQFPMLKPDMGPGCSMSGVGMAGAGHGSPATSGQDLKQRLAAVLVQGRADSGDSQVIMEQEGLDARERAFKRIQF